MKPRVATILASLCSLVAAAVIAPAAGADRFWIGNGFNENWSEGNNWSPASPPQDGDTLIFGNVGAQRSNNNNNLSNLRVQSIVFNSSGYSLRGNPILLDSDITAAHNSGNNSVRFGVQFTHGGGTFSVVNAGRLEVAGTVTLANRQPLIIFALGTNLTISGAIVGDGELLKLGEQALFLTGTAANTYTGPTTINSGSVLLNKSSGAQAISSRVSLGDNTRLNCFLADMSGGQYPPAMSMFVGDRGTWGLTNGATVTNLTINGGAIRGEGLLNLFCNLTNLGPSEIHCSMYLGDASRIFYTDNGDWFFAQLDMYGHILGPSGGANPPGIIKEGFGLVVLKNQNTYSGPTLINHGGISAEHPQALGTTTGETRVRPFGFLDVGRYFPTDIMTFSEPFVMEGGSMAGFSDVMLNGPFTLNADSRISGPTDERLDIATSIIGPGGLIVRGGHVRFSGPAANAFAGAVVVEPAFLRPEAILELAKPNDVAAVPTTVTLQGFGTNLAILRNFQDNGARDISILDGGVWHLNGFAATPNSLRFLGGGLVDTGFQGTFPGILNFAGSGVNTQLQVLPKQPSPGNYTARIQGRVDLFSSTNDVLIPPGLTLDFAAEIRGLVLRKRGPGKLILGGDNRFLGRIFAQDGELISRDDRALGGHATVLDGATVWLDCIFNFGSLALEGRGFQGTNGALATSGLAIFSSNVVLTAPATINTATTNANLHIQAAISGTGPLTKEGVGLLTFEGSTPNTFAGDMLVNAGLFVAAKNSFIPAVPGDIVIGSGLPDAPGATVLYGRHDQVWNRIAVNRGSLLDLNGWDEYSGDVTLNEGGSVKTGAGTLYLGEGVNLFANAGPTPPSVVSGRIGLGPGPHQFRVGRRPGGGALDLDLAAAIVQMSSAADIVKEGPGAMGLRGVNTFMGALIINDGTVAATHPLAFGSSAGGTIVNGNAALQLSGDTSGTFWVREEPLTLNTTNLLGLTSFGRSNTWSGNITLQRTAAINVAFNGDVLNVLGLFDCCGGVISGPGGISKGGSGTLMITGFFPNDYAGPTVVNDGVLEAWRILSPALPGDVVVSGPNSALQTGRVPANTGLAAGASVTMMNGGLWTMNPTNRESIRELLGDGRLSLGTNATLTIDADNSHEFSGVLIGSGALEKRGPGQLRLSGVSPNYSGAATVFFGTLKVDGRIPNSPLTVKTGAELRGDGGVGNVTAIEQDSIVRVDASFADHPDRQAGDFALANLTLGPGGIAAFDLFGPSPTGGNDLLIANGAVNLDLARLSVEFDYPPREGDLITLIRKSSAGPINGVFAGWPEGATRKRGDVTVRASYVGGDGNDFTLTVTNLPVRPFNYRLAEGNGNQTVEPDECSPIFPIVANRTTNVLTITNAHLRSLTPGAAVTVASATYPVIPPGLEVESATPFQFRTDRSLSCGQPVTLELVLGVQNEGVFALVYEIIAGEGPDCDHPTGACESCLVVRGRFTTNAPALVRAHDFLGGPSTCFPPKRCPETNTVANKVAIPCLTHVFTNSTAADLCLTAQLRFGGVGAPTNALGAVAYLGTNDYHDACVNYLGDTGADGTQPFSFRVPAGTNFVILISARATNVVCDRYTLEVFGLPCPPPRLDIAKDAVPDNVLLQWSTAYPGYRLETTNGLASPSPNVFSDMTNAPVVVSGRYTVTNSAASLKRFYRLAR